jgi:hypothetical protein
VTALLTALQGVNRASLTTIESALFFAHLDLESKDISTWSERGRALIHGNGSTRYAGCCSPVALCGSLLLSLSARCYRCVC